MGTDEKPIDLADVDRRALELAAAIGAVCDDASAVDDVLMRRLGEVESIEERFAVATRALQRLGNTFMASLLRACEDAAPRMQLRDRMARIASGER